MPTRSAAPAAFPSATAARTAAPEPACSELRKVEPRRRWRSPDAQDAQGAVAAAELSNGRAAGGAATAATGARPGSVLVAERSQPPRWHAAGPRRRRPVRPAGALRAALRPHPLAVLAPF